MLDDYLSERAWANHVSEVARCYVSADESSGRVLGYYTLSAASVERQRLTARFRRNAPELVPAVLLGRLAVDADAQGIGLGRALLRDAVGSTLAAAHHIGALVLLVHAIDDRAAALYRAAGFTPSPTDVRHLMLSLARARATDVLPQ